jgi:hypothetical protein
VARRGSALCNQSFVANTARCHAKLTSSLTNSTMTLPPPKQKLPSNHSLTLLACSSSLYPTKANLRLETSLVSVMVVFDLSDAGEVRWDLKVSGVRVGGRFRKMRRDLSYDQRTKPSSE